MDRKRGWCVQSIQFKMANKLNGVILPGLSNFYNYICVPNICNIKYKRIKSKDGVKWVYSEQEKDEAMKQSTAKKVEIQRYKGLGEMTPEQLWETTMNPVTRTMLGVSIDDAARADHIFHVLMGGEVPPRKAFIQAHAKSVRNLDI